MRIATLFTMGMLVVAPGLGGCLEAPASDTDEASAAATAELAPGGVPASRGSFHVIKNVGSGKCLQPAGGSIAEGTPIIQADCGNFTADFMNWQIVQFGKDIQFRNIASGTCLYNDAVLPLRDGSRPINLQHCGDSNTLWRVKKNVGITDIMSRVQSRDTGFCIDIPGATNDDFPVQNYHCDGPDNLAQQYVIGLQ
jgi:hypothetical protein